GALADGAGAVVGINTTIFTTSSGGGQGGSIGLGFAIPINEARDIAEQLIRSGSVRHATLAVNARSVTQLNGNRDGSLIEAAAPRGGRGGARAAAQRRGHEGEGGPRAPAQPTSR